MTLLSLFITDLLKHHDGDIHIVADNARMTNKQKISLAPLTNTSLHSSNHSTARWLDETSTPPSSINDLNSSNHSITVPTRKPSYDVVTVSLNFSATSNKENSEVKSPKIRKGKRSQQRGFPPLSPSTKTKKKSLKKNSSRKTVTPLHQSLFQVDQLGLPSMPKRKTSPRLTTLLTDPASLTSLFKDEGRSLSKILLDGSGSKDEVAPKMPTRKLSEQPVVFSPKRAPSRSMALFAQSVFDEDEDASISPTEPSSTFSIRPEDGTAGNSARPPSPSVGKAKFFFRKPSGQWFKPLSKRT